MSLKFEYKIIKPLYHQDKEDHLHILVDTGKNSLYIFILSII